MAFRAFRASTRLCKGNSEAGSAVAARPAAAAHIGLLATCVATWSLAVHRSLLLKYSRLLARDARRFPRVCARLGHMLCRASVGRAWVTWADWARRGLWTRRVCHRAVQAMLLRELHAAWGTWASTATKRRILQVAFARVVYRLRNQAVLKAWARWLTNAGELRRSRRIVLGVVTALRSRLVVRAWHTWRGWWTWRRQFVATGSKVIQHLRNLVLGRAWNGWRSGTVGQAAHREDLRRYATRLRARAVRRALMAWTVTCWVGSKLAELFRRWETLYKALVFSKIVALACRGVWPNLRGEAALRLHRAYLAFRSNHARATVLRVIKAWATLRDGTDGSTFHALVLHQLIHPDFLGHALRKVNRNVFRAWTDYVLEVSELRGQMLQQEARRERITLAAALAALCRKSMRGRLLRISMARAQTLVDFRRPLCLAWAATTGEMARRKKALTKALSKVTMRRYANALSTFRAHTRLSRGLRTMQQWSNDRVATEGLFMWRRLAGPGVIARRVGRAISSFAAADAQMRDVEAAS